MPDHKKNTLGELTTIRDILMGEQMVEYDARFQLLEQKIQELAKRMEDALEALEKRQTDALEKLREESMVRFEGLAQQLAAHVQSLEQRIDTVSTSDRARLGQMLRELGRQLEGSESSSEG